MRVDAGTLFHAMPVGVDRIGGHGRSLISRRREVARIVRWIISKRL
jgi:hypothetical protein